MHQIKENLKILLRAQGNLTLTELSRKTLIPQPTLHHIIEGKTKSPRKHILEILAGFFSVSVKQLTGENPLPLKIPETIKKNYNIVTIPLLSWKDVITWKKDDYRLITSENVIFSKSIEGGSFALQLNHSGMEPLFRENSILIFEAEKKPKDRDFVLVYMKRLNNLFFNRLFIEDNAMFIKKETINLDAQLMKIDPIEDRIIATLIEARLPF